MLLGGILGGWGVRVRGGRYEVGRDVGWRLGAEGVLVCVVWLRSRVWRGRRGVVSTRCRTRAIAKEERRDVAWTRHE